MMSSDIARRAQQLVADREPFVHATVVRAVHPTSVRTGDSALVLRDGTIEGFVGGMCAQTSVRLYSVRTLESGEGLLLRLEPGVPPADGEPEPQDGVTVAHNPCLSGGSLEIFLDPQLPAPRIVVAGDMPIARTLGDVAAAAGYDVVRGEAADVEPLATDAALVVASHGDDEEIALTKALRVGVGYVALVASEVRGAAVVASLDVPDELRELVRTPAGLDIGARTPAEVAIAILAQFVEEATTRGVAPEAGAATSLPVVGPAIAIDPICGMEVVASDASVHLDTEHGRVYFCREGCRDRYVEQQAEHV